MKAAKNNPTLHLIPDIPFEWIVQAFLNDCKARNLSPNTVRIYSNGLRKLQRWTDKRDVEDVTTHDLRAFITHLQETGHNPGGVHQVYRVVKTFFRWLHEEGEIDQDPMERMRPPRVPQEPLEPVTLPDVRKLLSTCDRKTFSGDRDRALLLTLLDTGCRASEFVALNVGDVNFNTGAILVLEGKGRKFRHRVCECQIASRNVALPTPSTEAGPKRPVVGHQDRQTADL